MKWNVIRLASTSSTMDEVWARARDRLAEGLVVVADEQTSGQGRARRAWIGAAGSGLYCSILLAPQVPPDRLAVLSLVTGISVAETVEAFVRRPVQLKWPNDVLVDGRKISGILIQSRIAPGRIDAVLGIGINLESHPALPDTAIAVADLIENRPQRDTLLNALLANFAEHYAEFELSAGRPSLEAWSRRMAFRGERVRVVDGEQVLDGVLQGIDEDGALLLRLDDGGIRRVLSGELTRGPVPLSS